MKLRIRSQGFPLSKALARRVQRRFERAVQHGRRVVAEVVIRLGDINGRARKGIDKRCGVEMRLATGEVIMLRETDSNLYTAIDRAATRSKRTLLDRLRRLRSRRRDAGRATAARSFAAD